MLALFFGGLVKYICLILSLISFFSFSNERCEVTEEYKQSYRDASEAIRGPFKKCKRSEQESIYWKAVTKCVSEGKGKNIGGGCGHMVSYGQYPSEDVNTKHCDLLMWVNGDVLKYRKVLIEEKNIKRCKNHTRVAEGF